MGRHLTARLAWHDSGWNGAICKKPSCNFYCIGTRSLLSDRLRRDRDTEIEDAEAEAPADKLLPEYAPPCFWGINAFGNQDLKVLHRHAFADLRDTQYIDDAIPPFSVITWPFRISFNHDKETKNRYGNYHPDLEQRINIFYAAHHEEESLVFLYLNYDNPVSGDQPLYAVVGCGLLKKKGKPTHFEFSKSELNKYRSGPNMQNFPTVNWARTLTLDPDTVVRLPYQEYVQHVRKNSDDEQKLDEISVLVSDDALVPSFKYVCDSMDDDQCLYLLYQLRQAFDRIDAHGIVKNDSSGAIEKLDQLIKHVWQLRGPYSGLPSAIAYLEMIGTQADHPKLDHPEQLVKSLRNSLSHEEDLIEEIKSLITSNQSLKGSLKPYKRLLRNVRRAAQDDPEILDQVLRLSCFSLSPFQIERILSVDRPDEEPAPFGHRKISSAEVIENPYLLAESYTPTTDDSRWKWAEIEHPLRRDGPIGVFHIDSGLFPNDDWVDPQETYNLSPVGPQRMRALVLQHLNEQATRRADAFSTLDRVHAAVLKSPLFYRRTLKFRKEVLTSSRFAQHFSDRIRQVNSNGKDYFYLEEIKSAEELVERILSQLVDREDHVQDETWVNSWVESEIKLLDGKFTGFDMETFRDERRAAMEKLLRKSFVVLSGRPGSGKTFVIAEFVKRLVQMKKPVTTLAPTGKAVLRLVSESNIDVETIDKFLYRGWAIGGGITGPESISKRSLKRLEEIQNLVIDECSMLDLSKLATIFRILDAQGLNNLKRVIFVGDVNQLPPIGLGRPFEDIVSWIGEDQARRDRHHIHLETNCRQQTDSQILEVAEIFVARNRYYDDLLERVKRGGRISDGLKVILWEDTTQLASLIGNEITDLVSRETSTSKEDYHQGLNLLFGLEKDGSVVKNSDSLDLERFQILTPYHGRYGHAARELNEFVHRQFKQKWWPAKSGFSHGEKIIRLSNKYGGDPRQLMISNGSIGVVNTVKNSENAKVWFPFSDSAFYVGSSEKEEFDLAYAITVHKAQGSDFNHVFVVLSSHLPLLTRELVYTALTRSKDSVTIFLESSEISPLDLARRRSAVLNRNSSIFAQPLDRNQLLQPEPGEFVDSKVEYIIYSSLMTARNEGRLKFSHHQKLTLNVFGKTVFLQPDFQLETSSGKWILEHLGMLDRKQYSTRWKQKKLAYESAGLGDRLITTDDLNGIRHNKLNKVIDDICNDNLVDTSTSQFSKHHYELWGT